VLDPRIEQGVYQDGSEESCPIGVQLRRNRRVWDVHSVLEPDSYRLWPWVLQEFVMVPTLLYRFVRKSNVDGWRPFNGRRRRRDRT
jgi:hypothetical protein